MTQNTIFKAFPNGSEPLSMRIAALVGDNPNLAPELITYRQTARGLSRTQKLAAEHGLVAAGLIAWVSTLNRAALRRISGRLLCLSSPRSALGLQLQRAMGVGGLLSDPIRAAECDKREQNSKNRRHR
jgi:hypothetical protein